MKKQAIVAGHICIDITPVFPAGNKTSRACGRLDGARKAALRGTAGHSYRRGGSQYGLGMKVLGAEVS